jgi:hypothetical protein
MEELIRTDDPVFLSALLAALEGAGIEALVFDDHTSSVFPGVMDTLGRRVMVESACAPKARRILAQVAEARNR